MTSSMATKTFNPHVHINSAKEWGGGEQYIFNLCEVFKARGQSSIVLTDARYPAIGKRFAKVATVIELNLSKINTIGAVFKAKRALSALNPASINAHSGRDALFGILLAKQLAIPAYLFKHNVVPGKNDWYHNALLKNLKAVICVSDLVLEKQLANTPETLKSKFVRLYNGVKLPAQTTARPQNAVLTLGYAGRIVENKGLGVLLKATESLSLPFQLKIAGSVNNDWAQGLCDRYASERVEFLGQVENMDAFYASIDLLVAPSIVPEAFGLTIAEAMAHGVSVIATRSGAQGEIVTDGVHGRVIMPNDPEALATCIAELQAHPETLTAYRETCRGRIESAFTIDTLCDNLMALYKTA